MKNALISFLVGVIVGGGGVWYLSQNSPAPQLEDVGRRLEALELDPRRIDDEMTRTGQVVRRRTQELGQIVAEATADLRITAAIKAQLLRDPELSAWDISVSTTDGRVTLSGTVRSAEHVGRAILLAYDTAGVHEVLSTLRVAEQR